MFSVIPAICMITSAVRIDSGMLTAATNVERRFNRNRKIVMTAKIAPRPPSRSRPSLDSRMNVDWSATVAISISPGMAGGDLVELRLDVLSDRDGVRGAGLADRDRHRGLAVRRP
jgi:hypothetical protein